MIGCEKEKDFIAWGVVNTANLLMFEPSKHCQEDILTLKHFPEKFVKIVKEGCCLFSPSPLYSTLVTIRRLLFKIGVYLLEYGEQEINEDEETLSWKQPLPNIYLSRTFEAFMYIEFLMIF